MDPIDLDAARAARAADNEESGERPPVILNGRSFDLPERLPFQVVGMLGRGEIEESITALLGDQAPTFWAQVPDVEDVVTLVSELVAAYGVGDLGESSASGGSSRNTSTRSRPTSNGSTRSISTKRRAAASH